jgi:hypothetical protein
VARDLNLADRLQAARDSTAGLTLELAQLKTAAGTISGGLTAIDLARALDSLQGAGRALERAHRHVRMVQP